MDAPGTVSFGFTDRINGQGMPVLTGAQALLSFAEHYIGSDLRNPDFMQLAKAFGALGMPAKSPQELRDLLPKALAARAPVPIEAPVGAMPAWQPRMPRGRARR
jgi:thiamine pyrophosphate-dependent acetolactate synthase large subunit-like protein